MYLQIGKDLKHKTTYDHWKRNLYEKGENKMKKYYSLLSNEEADYPRVSIEETSPHKCNICGKRFDTGRALGGHKRSHFQASENKFKTLFTNNSKEGTSLTFNDEKKDHICYVCKKIFSTNKALYGHMRSHPDRFFKGMSPPTDHHHHHLSHDHNKYCSSSISINSNSSMEHNKKDQEDGFVAPKGFSDIDVSKSALPKWKKRDKRGRKCSESYEAAITLMHLSGNTNYLCSGMSIKKFEQPKSFVELSSMKKKREIGESSSYGKEHAIKKIKIVFSGSLKLGNKTDDVVGTSNTVSCDNHMLEKGEGLCESESKVKEIPLVGESSQSATSPKRLYIDLNEPYIMEE